MSEETTKAKDNLENSRVKQPGPPSVIGRTDDEDVEGHSVRQAGPPNVIG